MDNWSLLQKMLGGNGKPSSKRTTPELTQGVEVPFEQRKYDAPREIAGPPKPIEAVVPRILTDTMMGVPSTVASILRSAADYYPEKYTKTAKNKTIDASLPDWFLTALTDPNYKKTELGKKAIEYAKKNLDRKENLQRKLSLREEDHLRENANKFITPNEKIPSDIPLADEGFKLTKNPKSDVHEQSYHLETPVGQVPNWVNVTKDFESVPSVGFLNDLPEQLKGNALAAQAYTQLAKQYGTLRSDPSGSSSTDIRKAVWEKFGQPFEHNFGGGYGKADRYELPFSVNAQEMNKPILERYKNLGEQAADEADLLRRAIHPDKKFSNDMPEDEFWKLGNYESLPRSRVDKINSYSPSYEYLTELPKELRNKVQKEYDMLRESGEYSSVPHEELMEEAINNLGLGHQNLQKRMLEYFKKK